MITLFEAAADAVWRASWQAAVLAVVIALLLTLLGQRMAARWRYLLLGVVIARLLLVVTPASSWSVFNLAQMQRPEPSHGAAPTAAVMDEQAPLPAIERPEPALAVDNSPPEIVLQSSAPAEIAEHDASTAPSPISLYVPAAGAEEPIPSWRWPDATSLHRALAIGWLIGCVACGAHLLTSFLLLYRRLSACRPVTDAALLRSLDAARLCMGLKRTPVLLVTPEPISPCIVGTWKPRVILPEGLITDSSRGQLEHVLAHELAHVARGDLWTNWLLLSARVLHWFNPVAWWVVREMQAEREAACDELALAAANPSERSSYAATILDLAARLKPSPVAPGLIGWFSSTRRLAARVERLLRSPSIVMIRTPIAIALLAGLAVVGLTDAVPTASAEPLVEVEAGPGDRAQANVAADTDPNGQAQPATHTIAGRCADFTDRTPLEGVRVKLFRVQGLTAPPEQVAEATTGPDGGFEFTNLTPPNPYGRFDRLLYEVFALADDRAIGFGGLQFPALAGEEGETLIRMARETAPLSGRVIDERGQPVAGAIVSRNSMDGRPVPGILSAVTDEKGRFTITGNMVQIGPVGKPLEATFSVRHPDYPETTAKAKKLPADVEVKLPSGCTISGGVTDAVTGRPAAGAVVIVQHLEDGREFPISTDAEGQFRIVVAEGRYNVQAEAVDRVCVALTDQNCVAGETLDLPALKLVAGGFIFGRVINTATDETISQSDGWPIKIGLDGPSHPHGAVISPRPVATVDDAGRFKMRAAPGENFPYFVNIRGHRMAWNTRSQPPVIVEDGEITLYNMLVTPPAPASERLAAARKVVEALPDEPTERTKQIIAEFSKLNHTVDETELWCTLMRELVTVGKDAVPVLGDELDRTTEDRMLRRLAFALRAIGDRRAVPALIRAIPKTLHGRGSDYGLIVDDPELTEFMQQHDLDGGRGGNLFGFGRPQREIFGALHRLTGQDFGDLEMTSISLSEDPRRAVLQRRILTRHAQRWQTWWEAHWHEFTDDKDYQFVNLKVADEELPPAPKSLGPKARVVGVWSGATLSPAVQQGQHAWHFYDLDTDYRPKWPDHLPRDETKLDDKQLLDWARKTGVDLMCVTRTASDGSTTYVLRALDMKVSEIRPRELRNLDKLVAAGKLPEGREAGELLMHYDAERKELVPEANGAFLFTTREGNMGLIEVTDHILRTEDITGAPSAPAGVGFFLGVKFDLKTIIP